ncbi:reverse transcriptase domain-containing protein [Tanacetum coccineum]
MEIDTTPSSPTLMMPARVPTGKDRRKIEGGPWGGDMIKYSSEDVDEEREMEAPLGYQSQPLGGTKEQGMKGIPRLLAAHLQETERRRRTLSPREALNARRSLVYEVHHSIQQHHIRRGYSDGRQTQANVTEYHDYPPNNDTTRVWWNSLPKGVVENYEDLKRRFRSRFKQHKKQTKTHLAINGIKRKEAESVRAFITRYTDETAQITRLNEDQRIAGFIYGVKIKSLVKFVPIELPKSYGGLIKKVYSLLQAEETASEGKLITFMDRNAGEKPLKGRP